MAFPNGWGRRCKITIESSEVDATLTDYPVLILVGNLPSEMVDNDGPYPALEGGGDIRFSSDEAGQNQLALDVKSFHLDNAPQYANSAQLFVKIPSLSSSVDTDIWVWWNKAGETQPGVATTYGRNAVWKDTHISVWHLNEDSGSVAVDACGRHDGTFNGTLPNKQWAGLGQGQQLNGTSDYISIPDHADFNQYQDTTLFIIANSNDVGGEWRGCYTKDREQFSAHTVGIWRSSDATGQIHYRVGQNSYQNTNWSTSGFRHLILKWAENGGIARGWVDYVEDWSGGTTASGEPANGTNPIYIGRAYDGGSSEFFSGKVTEARWIQGLLSDDWITTMGNNYTDIANFLTTGSPETPELASQSEKAIHRGIHKGIHKGIS